MQGSTQTITQTAALAAIYKNARMGADGIIDLLPYVKQSDLCSMMTLQLDGYEKYATLARTALEEVDSPPKDAVRERLMAKMGAAWRGMLGITRTELVKILIESSNACITDMTYLLNHIDVRGGESARLAHELIGFETHNVEALKAYL